MIGIRPRSHNNSHNKAPLSGEAKGPNSMCRNSAPGETRTPNLLIRSHSTASAWLGRVIGLRSPKAPLSSKCSPTQTPKDASASHNNSHNESVGYATRVVRKRRDTVHSVLQANPGVSLPDIYADSKVFLVWRLAA